MNKQLILKKRPIGIPSKDTWSFELNPILKPKDGEVLIEHHYISLDPAMRGWIMDRKSYIPPVQIDEVMRSGSIGKVIESNNHPTFKVGDCVVNWGGVQQYFTTNGENCFKVDDTMVPMPKYLGVLGMPGMTAYFGILNVGKIKAGDVVLVSGAAGAVGSLVGQIAKLKGCTVIGIAGGKEKNDYLINELGFDHAIDYKSENLMESLAIKCPKGIDVYFDNVGGEILDAALTKLRFNARVVICGAISQYNNENDIVAPKNYLSLLVNRATMQGMVVLDYASEYQEAGLQMAMWMMEGKIKSREDIYEGLDNFYETFLRLFNGNKKGKLLLKIK